jgi:hypothetical protein
LVLDEKPLAIEVNRIPYEPADGSWLAMSRDAFEEALAAGIEATAAAPSSAPFW